MQVVYFGTGDNKHEAMENPSTAIPMKNSEQYSYNVLRFPDTSPACLDWSLPTELSGMNSYTAVIEKMLVAMFLQPAECV
jgi:hypothetical protein